MNSTEINEAVNSNFFQFILDALSGLTKKSKQQCMELIEKFMGDFSLLHNGKLLEEMLKEYNTKDLTEEMLKLRTFLEHFKVNHQLDDLKLNKSKVKANLSIQISGNFVKINGFLPLNKSLVVIKESYNISINKTSVLIQEKTEKKNLIIAEFNFEGEILKRDFELEHGLIKLNYELKSII